MTGAHLAQRWLRGLVDRLDRAGERLSTWHQGITIATCGRLPARDISALKLGIWAASLALGGVVFVGALLCAHPGGLTPVMAGPREAGSQETPFTFVIRCRQCGWSRALGPAEIDCGVSHAGAYRCEQCRMQTAYPVRTPRGTLVTDQPEVRLQ